MNATLRISQPIIAYAEYHSVEPIELAQFVLDEHGRECAELLLLKEGPCDDSCPIMESEIAFN